MFRKKVKDMRDEPKHYIHKNAINIWRVRAIINIIIFSILLIGALIGTVILFFVIAIGEIPIYYYAIIIGVISLLIILFVFIVPKIRYRRWRYEIYEQEIYIQHGILIMTRTIVPMIRVQHVDTIQGPILKKYGLSTVTISTAATTHEIPALTDEDASNLRDQISVLARVDEDDV